MKEEMVLVIRRSLRESLGMFQGLRIDVDRYLAPMLVAKTISLRHGQQPKLTPA